MKNTKSTNTSIPVTHQSTCITRITIYVEQPNLKRLEYMQVMKIYLFLTL